MASQVIDNPYPYPVSAGQGIYAASSATTSQMFDGIDTLVGGLALFVAGLLSDNDEIMLLGAGVALWPILAPRLGVSGFAARLAVQ